MSRKVTARREELLVPVIEEKHEVITQTPVKIQPYRGEVSALLQARTPTVFKENFKTLVTHMHHDEGMRTLLADIPELNLSSGEKEIKGAGGSVFHFPHIYKQSKMVRYESETAPHNQNYVFSVGNTEDADQKSLQVSQCSLLNNINELLAKLIGNTELILDEVRKEEIIEEEEVVEPTEA